MEFTRRELMAAVLFGQEQRGPARPEPIGPEVVELARALVGSGARINRVGKTTVLGSLEHEIEIGVTFPKRHGVEAAKWRARVEAMLGRRL